LGVGVGGGVVLVLGGGGGGWVWGGFVLAWGGGFLGGVVFGCVVFVGWVVFLVFSHTISSWIRGHVQSSFFFSHKIVFSFTAAYSQLNLVVLLMDVFCSLATTVMYRQYAGLVLRCQSVGKGMSFLPILDPEGFLIPRSP